MMRGEFEGYTVLIVRYDVSTSIFNGAIVSAATAVVKPTNARQVSKWVPSPILGCGADFAGPSDTAASTTYICPSRREVPEYMVNPYVQCNTPSDYRLPDISSSTSL
jgi:hypothetical protein